MSDIDPIHDVETYEWERQTVAAQLDRLGYADTDLPDMLGVRNA